MTKKNTNVTKLKRTDWMLCTIVILFMCKYMPMFVYYLSVINEKVHYKAVCLLLSSSTFS